MGMGMGVGGEDAAFAATAVAAAAAAAVRAVPSPATNGDGQPTVTVEESDQAGGMVIKVVCPDRRGLLQAILGVMRKLGLDVTRAVIATPDCGNVDDTFEVQQGDTACDKERIR